MNDWHHVNGGGGSFSLAVSEFIERLRGLQRDHLPPLFLRLPA